VINTGSPIFCDRLSPINRRSFSDRVSTPERLSVNRLSSLFIAASPDSDQEKIYKLAGGPRVPSKSSFAPKRLVKIISASGYGFV
jgi:hypothetical protein